MSAMIAGIHGHSHCAQCNAARPKLRLNRLATSSRCPGTEGHELRPTEFLSAIIASGGPPDERRYEVLRTDIHHEGGRNQ
jgi:hypothetical protein